MINLSTIDTRPPEHLDRDEIEDITKKNCKKIGDLSEKLMASGQHSILVVLQGLDASGKDGAVGKVFRYCSAANLSVSYFRKPTDEEMAHDFLWRVHKLAPRKGDIKIFVRSHYEDILIQHVRGWIDDERRDRRMESINAFEKLLEYDSNCLVLKFYLHLSKEQQEVELMQRVKEHDKHWKHKDGDWEERAYWDKYRDAYEYVLNRSEIPWHIVPVDSRWYRDYVMSTIILEKLEALDLQWPPLESDRF